MFDLDGSGTIDKEELKAILHNFGLKPTATELDEIVADIDKDGDGEIDYTEFLRLMAYKLKDAKTEQELMEAFKVFDSKKKQKFGEQELIELN